MTNRPRIAEADYAKDTADYFADVKMLLGRAV
jgi:hypothetical protein